MSALRGANLGLRFLLELAALAATAYWGYGHGWALALLAPAAVIVVWALFVAPTAAGRVPRPVAFAIELAVWAAAGAALAASGQLWLGVSFVCVAVASGLLNYVSSGTASALAGASSPR